MSQPTVLAVDGNSLLHRAFHASARSGFRLGRAAGVGGAGAALAAGRGGRPGLRGRRRRRASTTAATARARSGGRPTRPTGCPSRRRSSQQLDLAVDVLRALGVVVVVPPGLEADDVLASVAAQAPALGARTVVATSDRDSFSLIDEHTRMLRILNGGVDASPLLDPDRLAMVTGVRPEQYSDLAALRGDASDNLPGVHGVRRQDRGQAARPRSTPPRPRSTTPLAGGERCRAAVGLGARQDAGDHRGARALRPQPRGHGDGHRRRARPRPARRRCRGAAARRGDRPVGASAGSSCTCPRRSGRSPSRSPPGRSSRRTSTRAGPPRRRRGSPRSRSSCPAPRRTSRRRLF